MALNPSGQISIGGPTVGQSINLELGLSATANSSLNQANFRALAGIPSGTISMSNFYGKSRNTQLGMFAFGILRTPTNVTNISNLVSNTGVVAADRTGVGTARRFLSGTGYGGDKGVFAFGGANPPSLASFNMTNLVSNTGVIATDTAGVSGVSLHTNAGAASYGGDKAIFLSGSRPLPTPAISLATANYFSNTGVMAADTPTGIVKSGPTLAATYGGNKVIWYGNIPAAFTNYISDTGVIGASVPAVGTLRNGSTGGPYGGDKCFFWGGATPPVSTNLINLVSNTGVMAASTPTIAAVRGTVFATGYGGDKAIFGFGASSAPVLYSDTNLVSNTGVVSSQTPNTATQRQSGAACGYSYT